ncbi:MAG: bifunctional metallophosphatase/5'-nucleotidase [Bacteroidota bacterium]
MKRFFPSLIIISLLLLFGCKAIQDKSTAPKDDGIIEVQILQLNDVYEIAPLSGGKVGGMARVATIRKQLLAKNPNTYTIMAGDFLSPSVIATIKHEGERIRGKQMVEAMNSVGIDLAIFGNHEFDLKEADLLKRIDESQFEWLASNVKYQTARGTSPFQKTGGAPFPEKMVKTFTDADGTTLRLGLLGVTLSVNNPDYVVYEDVNATAKRTYSELAPISDAVIAITHLEIRDDKALAKQLQEVPLFMGGHDHNNMSVREGKVTITKADANAKTVYVHTLRYNQGTKQLSIKSKLMEVDEKIEADPATAAVVQKWMQIAYEGFEADGLNPKAEVVQLKQPINGKEDVIRHQPTILSSTIVKSISAAAPKAQAAIMNTGSIRIDDWIDGVITQYDIVRILPYGGEIYELEITGALLRKVIDVGLRENVGIGGYLALDRIEYDPTTRNCKVQGRTVEDDAVYRIALPAFLAAGREQNLSFLKEGEPGVKTVIKPSDAADDLKRDIQFALIDYLENNPIPKQP